MWTEGCKDFKSKEVNLFLFLNFPNKQEHFAEFILKKLENVDDANENND